MLSTFIILLLYYVCDKKKRATTNQRERESRKLGTLMHNFDEHFSLFIIILSSLQLYVRVSVSVYIHFIIFLHIDVKIESLNFFSIIYNILYIWI